MKTKEISKFIDEMFDESEPVKKEKIIKMDTREEKEDEDEDEYGGDDLLAMMDNL